MLKQSKSTNKHFIDILGTQINRREEHDHAHWKPDGTFFSQALRSRLRETGTLRLMPNKLAFMAVQRHTAASRSASPWRRVQQGVTGGVPTTTPVKPPSKLAQTPSLSASLGHVTFGGEGVGFGLGLGGVGHVAPTREKKRMFTARKIATDVIFLELIS